MSVLMHDNLDDFEALLQLSQQHGVGHQTTLVSTGGTMRQDSSAAVPAVGAGARLLALKTRYPHFISFSGYLAGIDTFLSGGVRTPCHAGERFLNIDHLGDVSPCIEKLGWTAGNLVREPYAVIAARLAAMEQVKTCADCWTSCRGFVEEMSGMPKLRSWREFFTDFSKGRSP
jgi:MoaA/NifB/PqqE/SkfB family radical SAM enzyme